MLGSVIVIAMHVRLRMYIRSWEGRRIKTAHSPFIVKHVVFVKRDTRKIQFNFFWQRLYFSILSDQDILESLFYVLPLYVGFCHRHCHACQVKDIY